MPFTTTTVRLRRGIATWAMALLAPCGAWALQISSVSPQGEVAEVSQLVVKFNEPAVRFGDPRAPAPVTLHCSDAEASRGSGRWTSDREWVLDFAAELPAGLNCTVQARPGFMGPNGQALTPSSTRFGTGGPFVRQVRPGPWQALDEEQFFLLELSGPATAPSAQANIWCALQGVGERIAIRPLDGRARDDFLKALGRDKAAAREPLRYLTFSCARRLTPGARVQLVYGAGVATPSGVANRVEKRFDFQVREPFAASFSCERENAQAGCLPIRPLQLAFNAPVPRKLAEAIVLKTPSGSVKPRLEDSHGDGDSVVTQLSFEPPFAESARLSIELPRGLQDASGRELRNAANFPLAVRTGAMPPLAKFAASPFGIVERLAEPDGVAVLPVTLRNVEPQLRVQGLTPSQGQVSSLSPRSDAEIIAWQRKLQRYDDSVVSRKLATAEIKSPIPKPLDKDERDWVQTRMLSVLAGQGGTRALALPQPAAGDPRPFEVVGIPLEPGFHVVEISSRQLGAALLDGRHGEARTMYVRSSALVTNLAVHFKLGRENALAWVTTLDKGRPVAQAQVRVSDCSGRELTSATTDASGVARLEGLSSEPPACQDANRDGRRAYFVSARASTSGPGTRVVQDLAFTWSDWHKGIEPWRFNLPTSSDARPDLRAHTIFDRTLLRAGETVSMKHLVRAETRTGFGLPDDPPTSLVITHLGSGQQFTQAIAWRATGTGGRSAESEFAIPAAAKLGLYRVALRGKRSTLDTGEFRVEEFRLPVLEGRIAPSGKAALVASTSTGVDVQVNYVSGGGAANLPVRVSALVRGKFLSFPDHDGFSFSPPQNRQESSTRGEEDEQASNDARVVADKLPLTLDRNGAGRVTVDKLPIARQPQELLLEASYADPNGEVQTLRSTSTLWPAGVVAGIKTESWVSTRQQMKFQALALDLAGKPRAGVALAVKAQARITTTSRKRMVGGFYTYDNRTEVKDLGEVCAGKSDARGLLLCEATLKEAGEVELVAVARDDAGRAAEAASSVWVTRQGELWFGGENNDRIDVLPEKKSYQPGETARLQVRMPFRFATALVAIEREGILDTQVVQLNGQDPTVQLQVREGWGPNVYVSVLALRGRLREVPWYSFFTWGYQAPREWWTAFWYEGREYVAPTALVDLSKPAFRLGVAEIRVGAQAHRLDVQVSSDRESYPVRGKAQVTIRATRPDGQPAAGAEVALAAVDQALLELMPNDSWDLLGAMLQRRAWGVETSTAHMEIIGRRHYGRKAVAPGGGGGRSNTRELLDTLLLWNPRVVLDARGQAQVMVPLNDALTTFRVVAVADAGTGLFGTGEARIRATQDLQIISGLPPLVREDDQYRAQFTLRNTTKQAMKVQISPRATLLELAPQTVDVPAGEAREVAWNVTAPAQLALSRAEAILWEVEARDVAGRSGGDNSGSHSGSGARDALKVTQRIVPAVPLTVQQATLAQVDGTFSLDIAAPADALPGRGGLRVAMQPRLSEGLPGVRAWFASYPFGCLEQKTSQAVGLRDGKRWQAVLAQLPAYLDADGLASYFPPREGDASRGSDTLTAYLLAATHEAASLNPAFALPDEARAPLERGLINFVEGRIQREFWSPRKDLDIRKLAAIEALSRYGRAQPRMLQSITLAPNQWPTHAVIDWLNILRRMSDIPQRAERLAQAQAILRARLSFQGTKLVFGTERDDHWWWLMQGGDTNAARLLLAVMDDPDWKDDIGRLAAGFIGRQQGGAWTTTTANLWGGLALEKFSTRFESQPVTGQTRLALAQASASIDWSRVERVKPTDAAGAPHQASLFGAPSAPGMLRNNTAQLPWPASGGGSLTVSQQGSGKPWATIQSVAAVVLKAPVASGYQVSKTVTPVEQAEKGRYTRGDVLRVTLEVQASTDMTWVAITDPIPAGATILGSGLGRDSQIATQGEKPATGAGWPAYEERSFEAFRSYYEYLPKGRVKMEYTIRLNNVGDFALPPSRVEAMYAPEMFGALPNERLKVEPAR